MQKNNTTTFWFLKLKEVKNSISYDDPLRRKLPKSHISFDGAA
jgi:hypothetical protein